MINTVSFSSTYMSIFPLLSWCPNVYSSKKLEITDHVETSVKARWFTCVLSGHYVRVRGPAGQKGEANSLLVETRTHLGDGRVSFHTHLFIFHRSSCIYAMAPPQYVSITYYLLAQQLILSIYPCLSREECSRRTKEARIATLFSLGWHQL